MNLKLFILSSLLLFTLGGLHAQTAYRINADILTKTRLLDSTFQVSKGKLYYDQNFKKIVFDFSFPQKEVVVMYDTTMYTFRKDTLHAKTSNLIIPEQSFFHFMLSGQISNYGLEQSSFSPQNVEKKDGMVITTWMPPDNMKTFVSKVLIASKQKRLYSVTMFDGDDVIRNRQILKNYELINGVEIPTEILVATYYETGAVFQIIQLKNLNLNALGNDEFYNYKL